MRARRLAALAVATVFLTVTACSGSGGSTPQATLPSDLPTSPTSPATTKSPATTPPTLARFYAQTLRWASCHGSFQCASLVVPVDYANPSKSTLNISVVRLRASGKRIGSLVINPGGPGGSGVDYALAADRVITQSVRQRFDVVGFDPRGVGRSSPIRCLAPSALDHYIGVDPSPDTSAELSDLVNSSKGFANGCKARSGRLLPFVSTVNAARDMDILRAALGDAKFTYLGKSYGTFLGATYAQLFPTHIRALLLDGALDPSLSAREIDRTQAGGFEVALAAFLRDCVASGCPLGSSYDAARRRLEQLIASTDQTPLSASNAPGDDGRKVNEAYAVVGVAAALYVRSWWPTLRAGLGAALHGDGSVLLQLADNLTDRHTDGTYGNLNEANMAVNCLDRPLPKTLSTYQRDAVAWRKEAPHFGPLIAFGDLACSFWPVPPTGRPAPLTAKGAPPILVIGTTRDPATPYNWARALAGQLTSGVLLSYDGDGHTVYGEGSRCVDRIGDAYLINLTVPKDGTRC
jgi:pimeloyl-ACP methyl ester carboxylesterase